MPHAILPHAPIPPAMRRTVLTAALSLAAAAGTAAPAWADNSCGEARGKMAEASALRYQARQEARLGNRDRVCDTLDEIGDRYNDAQGAFEDCGREVVSIELRSEQRNLRIAKRANGCD